MATSTLLPNKCPTCGYVFLASTSVDISAHLLGHLLMQAVVGATGSRNPDNDW